MIDWVEREGVHGQPVDEHHHGMLVQQRMEHQYRFIVVIWDWLRRELQNELNLMTQALHECLC